MPAWNSGSPYKNENDDFLNMVIFAFILCLFFMAVSGCASKKVNEPEWLPDDYTFTIEDGKPAFYNYLGDRIGCEDPRMHDMKLIPADKITEAVKKFDRCKEWNP